MRLLLDTHVFLWYEAGDERLSPKAKEIIDAKTGLYFSIVCLWEISIKVNIGKLQLGCSFQDLLTRLTYIRASLLPISVEDVQSYMDLTLPSDHRDPFDRMLLTQATNHSLVIVSADSKFDLYSVQRIWED